MTLTGHDLKSGGHHVKVIDGWTVPVGGKSAVTEIILVQTDIWQIHYRYHMYIAYIYIYICTLDYLDHWENDHHVGAEE